MCFLFYGYFLEINKPGKLETGNVKYYFSEHYCFNGINVQAACDHLSRFVYVSVVAPGSWSDIREFQKCKLGSFVDNLTPGKFLIGDNAYCLSNNFLTPFSGVSINNELKYTYNFF